MKTYRIVEGIAAYFVTFTVVEWLPVFKEEAAFKIVIDSLNFSIENKHLGVNAYVIMPDHMHAIIFDKNFDNERLKHTLNDLRKFTGRQLLDYTDTNLPEAFGRTFREHAKGDRERKFWQSTIHAEGIYSEKFHLQKFNYIHLNPVRKGLVSTVEDWRFSSARYWLNNSVGAGQETSTNESTNDVELSAIGWD
jgi:putative transposase